MTNINRRDHWHSDCEYCEPTEHCDRHPQCNARRGTTTARTIQPGSVIVWHDGINPTATVERVTSDYRQRAIRVWSIHFDNGVTIEADDTRTFELVADGLTA